MSTSINHSLRTVVEYIKSDLYRYAGNVKVRSGVKQYIFNRSFRYTFWLRVSKSRNFIICFVGKVFHRILSNSYGIQIPREAQIGYGLYIGHHMSIVVSPSAVIGDNCNLSQFVTIGSNHGKAANIGNNVYIGPNVCLVENVDIGDDATIGAGAVVVKDVLKGCTAVGNPARVVSENNCGRYIKNKWLR